MTAETTAETPVRADPFGEAFDAAGLEGGPAVFRDAPSSGEFHKLRNRLARLTRQAIDEFGMVDAATRGAGKRWLVCLSGGKDSYTLLAMLMDLKWRGVLNVDLLACNLDQGQPNFPKEVLPNYLTSIGAPHRIEYEDTYSIVTEKIQKGAYCSLCSRLRRGNLYRVAREEGCEAVVLGHHREDILETFLLNLFHGGRLAAMPPKLINEEGDLLVLRPLALCAEAEVARFARAMAFPIIPCDLCGSQEGLQRNEMKALLAEWDKARPGRVASMFRAMTNVRPSHLLDRKLMDFAALQAPEPEASLVSALGESQPAANGDAYGETRLSEGSGPPDLREKA